MKRFPEHLTSAPLQQFVGRVVFGSRRHETSADAGIERLQGIEDLRPVEFR